MLIARFIVKTSAPLHVGGGSSVEFDQPVSRDPFGFWNIQASSLAGFLRSVIGAEDEDAARQLFGSSIDGGIRASDVWLSDAVLLDFDGRPAWEKADRGEDVDVPQGPFIRDHVKINLATGTAERSAKFDEEIVPPGAMFAFEMSLDSWNSDDVSQGKSERDNFFRLFNLIRTDGLQIGGKSVNGYGSFSTEYSEVREFDLKSEKGLEAWLNLSRNPKFAPCEGVEAEGDGSELRQRHSGIDAIICFKLCNSTPVLVGGANTLDSSYDMACLMTPVLTGGSGSHIQYRYTIPGSSTRGVLRHRVAAVAQALGVDGAIAADKVFGCIGANEAEGQGSMGHVSVKDVMIDPSARAEGIQHVAIDKFTGGAMRGALFDEAPIARQFDAEFSLNVRGLDHFGAKLLSHALLDLFTGDLPIGGGSSRGNGRFLLKGMKADGTGLKEALAGIKARVFVDGVEVNLKDAGERESLLDAIEASAPEGGK